MDKTQLQNYIQTWYANFLKASQVDVVHTDAKGAVFGFPDYAGATNYWRFIPYANGQVGVQYGEWPEHARNCRWFPVVKAPDIDALMMLDFGHELWEGCWSPSDTPQTPRTNYRY